MLFKKLTLNAKTLLYIILISLVPVFALYIPFILKLDTFFFLNIENPGFIHIFRNWDGPHYVIIAKTLYDLKEVALYLFTNVPTTYYPAHFPLYPISIAFLAPMFGYLYGGLIANYIFGILLNVLFYTTARSYSKRPLLLTFVFTVFPPRYLVTRAILAPETMMVFFIFLALILWEKRNYAKSAIAGSFGILTKVKAGFLFPAFLAESVERYLVEKKKRFPLHAAYAFLIPLTLLGLFVFYYFRTGDFFAFFNAEKGNELFITFPFAQFNSEGAWIQTAWLEDVVFYLAGMLLLTVTLFHKKDNRSWFYYTLFYTLFLIFIPQRDITRFSYPMYPLFLLTFEKFFTSKVFKWTLILLLPAIYFYSLNFMLQNQAPVANPGPLLMR